MPSPATFDSLYARSHPLRSSLSEEMHIRRLPRFSAPAQVLQIVALTADEQQTVEFVARLAGSGGQQFDPDKRYFTCRLGELDFAWERHTEFATYTFTTAPRGQTLFDAARFADVAALVADVPGAVIRATQIRVLDAAAPLPSTADLAPYFAADDLVVCDVAEGRARIWSDFRLHADGFGRLLIADRGLIGAELPQVVQRLQELGNYRKMALLGLPVAQRLMPEVTKLEQRLAALTRIIAEGTSDDGAALSELSSVSAELSRIAAEARYRLSASRAYAELSADRVKQLALRPVPGYQSLADFTDRRLLPAVRTCNAVSARLEDLSRHAERTSALLRTRIDTALARQNVDLLASMNRRTDLQLRLQQAVETLSIAAVSYYVIGLIGYVAKSVHAFAPIINPDVISGGAVLPAVMLVWLGLRVLKRP